MKPPPFEYVAVVSADEAVAELERHGEDAKLLAGGQSLMPILNFRLARPGHLIDCNRIAELGEPAFGDEANGATPSVPIRFCVAAEEILRLHPDIACMIGLWEYNPPALLKAVQGAKLGSK